MENFLKLLNVQTILFLYLLVGILCRTIKIFDGDMLTKLTDFVMFITLPCMVFDSFNMEFSLKILKEGMTALLIAVISVFFSLLLGRLIYRKAEPEKRSVMQFGTLVSSSAFTGLPLIEGTYGHAGLFLASIFIIPNRVFMWSAGIPLFTKTEKGSVLKKVLTNPNIIAVELGLLRMIFQISLPAVIDTTVTNIGKCTSPLAMMLVGGLLADVPLRSIFDGKAFYVSFVRQVVMPFAVLAALKLLDLDPLTLGVSVTLSGMPIASSTALMAQKYGADTEFASKCVLISTVTSLITVPVLALFL